jgi:cation transporter-like permease
MMVYAIVFLVVLVLIVWASRVELDPDVFDVDDE